MKYVQNVQHRVLISSYMSNILNFYPNIVKLFQIEEILVYILIFLILNPLDHME